MKLNDSIKVSLVTGVCLIGLIAILKNVIKVPAETLSRDIMIYIITYGGFMTSYSAAVTNLGQNKFNRPVIWNILIIFATLAIIGIYAV